MSLLDADFVSFVQLYTKVFGVKRSVILVKEPGDRYMPHLISLQCVCLPPDPATILQKYRLSAR